MKNFIQLFFLLLSFTMHGQLANVGFESTSCNPNSCANADSYDTCIDGWSAISDGLLDPNWAPLHKLNSCNEVVCSGNYAAYITSGTGTNNGILTDNTLNGNTPIIVSLDAHVFASNEAGTGISIYGFSLGNDDPSLDVADELGFQIPNNYGVCEQLAFLLPDNLDQYNKIGVTVGKESNQTNSQNAVIDDVDGCSMFKVTEDCGFLTIDFNTVCSDLVDIDNVQIEVYQGNNSIAFEAAPLTLELPANGDYKIVYYILLEGTNNYSIQSYDYVATSVGEMCCDESLVCSSISDLTACAAEGDFGFIQLDCDANTNVTYSWKFPTNSTGLLQTCDNKSTVLRASEGTYKVVVTDESGCSETLEFVVEEDCCPKDACNAPTNLDCINKHGQVNFFWEAVPEAISYTIQVSINDPACCGPVGPGGLDLLPITVTDNNWTPNGFILGSCFSWKVRSNCSATNSSSYSAKRCYSHGECFKPVGEHKKASKSNHALTPSVYPNPSQGNMTFQLSTPSELTAAIKVYSMEGRLIQSFPEAIYADGQLIMNWNPVNTLSDGIYLILFETNFGQFQEKIIIANNNAKY